MSQKLLKLSELADWRQEQRRQKRIVVATNGCFDILHVGHLRYLSAARGLGDVLVVGVNSDASVCALKGKGRPIHPAEERAELLAGLEAVGAVVIFSEEKATNFLKAVQPNVYVKGGDYRPEDLDSEEVAAVKEFGGKIEILPLVPGKSTTKLVKKIRG